MALGLLWSVLGNVAAAFAAPDLCRLRSPPQGLPAGRLPQPLSDWATIACGAAGALRHHHFSRRANPPPGQGSVAQGAPLYQQHCAACHGAQGMEGPAARLVGSDGFVGWNDPLRVLRILKHPLLVQSVGARWPYATTIFDYVRWATPYHAPKSLQDDEVYAITAHLLHRMGVVQAGAVMGDATTLPQVINARTGPQRFGLAKLAVGRSSGLRDTRANARQAHVGNTPGNWPHGAAEYALPTRHVPAQRRRNARWVSAGSNWDSRWVWLKTIHAMASSSKGPTVG